MTRAHCGLCGEEGYWGRFGDLKGIYIRGYKYSNPMERIGFLCPECIGISTREGRPLTTLEKAYLDAIRNGDRDEIVRISGEMRDLARQKA